MLKLVVLYSQTLGLYQTFTAARTDYFTDHKTIIKKARYTFAVRVQIVNGIVDPIQIAT